MEGIPTGTVGNAGPSGLVGDFFHTERRSILSDEIGLTRVRRGLLLEEAIGYRWFSEELFSFNLGGYGLPENRQISQDMYRLKPQGVKRGLPTE